VKFKLHSNYQPRGDQPTAIDQLVRGVQAGDKHQVLLGVTGSGKTFTMAKVIEALDRPALVLAHNKTLAAQLYHEFKSFFPENAVEYFVSYYDFYQPEAYVPAADVYIEKESTINDELDKLRMSATRSLFERRDVVIVASVSCIYGIGSPMLTSACWSCSKKGFRPPAKPCFAVSSTFSTNEAKICGAEHFGCVATSWKFIRLTKIRPTASRCGASRSTSCARSIH